MREGWCGGYWGLNVALAFRHRIGAVSNSGNYTFLPSKHLHSAKPLKGPLDCESLAHICTTALHPGPFGGRGGSCGALAIRRPPPPPPDTPTHTRIFSPDFGRFGVHKLVFGI